MTNPFQRSLEPALTQVGSLRTRGPRPGPAPHTRHNCRGAVADRPQAAVIAHEFPSTLITTPHTDVLRNVHPHGTRADQGNPSPTFITTRHHQAHSPITGVSANPIFTHYIQGTINQRSYTGFNPGKTGHFFSPVTGTLPKPNLYKFINRPACPAVPEQQTNG
jgi:hypothetical protein